MLAAQAMKYICKSMIFDDFLQCRLESCALKIGIEEMVDQKLEGMIYYGVKMLNIEQDQEVNDP